MGYSGTIIFMEFSGLTGIPPHDATHEKPSFLLLGMDCQQPIEAALLPQTSTNELVVSDYREELVKVLSSARQCAAKCIQNAQRKYKTE